MTGIELARAQRATFGRHRERHSGAPSVGIEGGACAVALWHTGSSKCASVGSFVSRFLRLAWTVVMSVRSAAMAANRVL
eukprot:6200218-Pleurochrysis_carterae.AAC.2